LPPPSVSRLVVTPIYEDVEASSRLFRELAAALGPDLYIVAVDDGSVRQPVSPAAIAAAGLHGSVIRLKRNVGHQSAIAVGLNFVADRFPDAVCVVMDSDGEDVPATILALLEPLTSSDVDAVVAQREKRAETLRFRAFYVVYKLIFQALSGRRISFGNFMALKPAAVRRLAAMQELWIHVASSLLVSKLRLSFCPLDRGPRYVGRSKMNFAGLVLHGFRALMVVAENVLVRVGLACAAISALSLLGIAASVVLKLAGYATPGWFSVALGILLIVLLQTGALTLMTLMLAGVMRSGNLTAVDYRAVVAEVLDADG
jgi:glycosyltransferase involved in cell wall biosynthesis